MTTRITQNMTARMLLSDLNDVGGRLQKTQQQIASGKQLTTPSDDPFGTSRALQLRSEVAGYDQYTRNVQEAQSWQSTTDTALSSISDLTLRARDLLVQSANGTLSPDGRAAIGAELSQIVDAIKSEANAQYGGRYVLAGTQTDTAPFQDATGDTYQGNDGAISRSIGPGSTVQVNVTGTSIGTLVQRLRTAIADVGGGDITAIGADLSNVDASHDALTTTRATVGALGNRLQTASDRLGSLQEAATKLLSNTEDADMAKTLVDYSTQQAVYQAALKAGANLIQPSLLDFLQ